MWTVKESSPMWRDTSLRWAYTSQISYMNSKMWIVRDDDVYILEWRLMFLSSVCKFKTIKPYPVDGKEIPMTTHCPKQAGNRAEGVSKDGNNILSRMPDVFAIPRQEIHNCPPGSMENKKNVNML